MKQPLHLVEHLSIAAVVQNGKAMLIDRHGRIICRAIPVSCIVGPVKQGRLERLAWTVAAKEMVWALHNRSLSRAEAPWTRKAKSLAGAFRVRRLDRPNLSGRRILDPFKTHTWEQAAHRMVQQGWNRYRRHARGGWNRWAHTVSGNHNKKMDARRAKEQRHGQTHPAHADGAGLQVRDQR